MNGALWLQLTFDQSPGERGSLLIVIQRSFYIIDLIIYYVQEIIYFLKHCFTVVKKLVGFWKAQLV
jgi:hypothetical protein